MSLLNARRVVAVEIRRGCVLLLAPLRRHLLDAVGAESRGHATCKAFLTLRPFSGTVSGSAANGAKVET